VSSYGASGVALGCLVCMAVAFPDTYLFRGVSISLRQAIWALIFLGSAGLVLLGKWSPFLLPQVSGVGFALGFLWLEPRIQAQRNQWRRKREEDREVRVREIRRRVDQLLAKISTEGYDSLTARERNFLKHASKYYKQEK